MKVSPAQFRVLLAIEGGTYRRGLATDWRVTDTLQKAQLITRIEGPGFGLARNEWQWALTSTGWQALDTAKAAEDVNVKDKDKCGARKRFFASNTDAVGYFAVCGKKKGHRREHASFVLMIGKMWPQETDTKGAGK